MKKIIAVFLALLCCASLGGCVIKADRSLSGEDAKALCFEHFGLLAKDCTVRSLEYDDGKYEIRFTAADTAYEVEVDGKSGKITEIDKKPYEETTADTGKTTKPDGGKPMGEAPVTMTLEEAQRIAVSYLSLSEGEYTFGETELEGIKYEIEIFAGGKEYNVEVNTRTGVVTEVEIDD